MACSVQLHCAISQTIEVALLQCVAVAPLGWFLHLVLVLTF
jgi:hypothetical protein